MRVLGFAILALAVVTYSPAQSVAAPPSLFQKAESEVAFTPRELAPIIRLRIAELEERTAPDEAKASAAVAFAAMDALIPAASPEEDRETVSATDKARERAGLWVEREAVIELLRLRAFDQTLSLARKAHTRHADLYGNILGVESRLPEHEMLWSQPGQSPLALLRECYAADHSFPYQGLDAVLRTGSLPRELKEQALVAGYNAAASDRDPQSLLAIAWVFTDGHAMAPRLDSKLVDAASAVLEFMQATPNVAAAQGAAGAAGRILAVMEAIDANRAEHFRQGFPWAARITLDASPPAPVRVARPPDTASGRPKAQPNMTLEQAEGLPDQNRRIALLLEIALTDTDRDAARTAADKAFDEMDEGRLGAHIVTASAVALRFGREFGDQRGARAMMLRCLAAASADATAAQGNFDSGDEGSRARIEVGLLRDGLAQESFLAALANAAQLDRFAAVHAADAVRSTIYAPLVYAAIAAAGRGSI